jgi:hypothetical protein
MTKNDFAKWSAVNRRIISRYKKRTGKRVLTKDDYMRMNLPMIVAKHVGPIRREHTNPFFSNSPGGGMFGFDKEAGAIAQKEMFDYVEERLKKSGLKKKRIVRYI